MKILIVEDNRADSVLIEKTLAKFNIKVDIIRDGEMAIKYLETESSPTLIILDLNLLRISGKTVLDYIKKHPKLKAIPVIIYTTSTSKRDVKDSYLKGANAYVSKPYSYKDVINTLEALGEFWLRFVEYD